MARKTKKIDLENIPDVQKKIISLIDQRVNILSEKEVLSSDDTKDLIACSTLLANLYKDYRAEVLEIKKELKQKSKEEILQIVKAEGSN